MRFIINLPLAFLHMMTTQNNRIIDIARRTVHAM